jgi:hypothetical protein
MRAAYRKTIVPPPGRVVIRVPKANPAKHFRWPRLGARRTCPHNKQVGIPLSSSPIINNADTEPRSQLLSYSFLASLLSTGQETNAVEATPQP